MEPGGSAVDRYTAIVAMTALIAGCITLATVFQAIATIATRRRKKDLADEGVARLEDRLLRIEQAVDAVAVEVERISENQRFTTRLLSERHVEHT